MIEHLATHPLGLGHLLAAAVAMLSGVIVLLGRKGTPRHRWIGRAYLAAMLAMNVSALGMYELDGQFGPFHWLAAISLGSVFGGYIQARHRAPGWRQRHAYFMAGSYVGVIAAAAAEVASRVPGWSFSVSVFASSLTVIVIGLIMMWRLVPRAL